MVAQGFPNVLTVHVSPQGATNGDKSFEALLSHTIGELSKSDSVYRANPEEASMVSRSLRGDAAPPPRSLNSDREKGTLGSLRVWGLGDKER